MGFQRAILGRSARINMTRRDHLRRLSARRARAYAAIVGGMNQRRTFYVYALFRPDGDVCYIGKGSGNRIGRHFALKRHHRNRHLARIIAAAGGELPAVILHAGLDEPTAFAYERAFIQAIGRVANGGPLVNLTDGGEGPSGFKFPPETVAAIAAKNRGRKRSPEVCAAISAAKIGQPRPDLVGKPVSEETRRKLSEANLGKPKPPVSPETRAKMSASHAGQPRPYLIGRSLSDEQREKLLAGARKPKSEEHKAKLRKPKSPEHRAALSAALRRRWEGPWADRRRTGG